MTTVVGIDVQFRADNKKLNQALRKADTDTKKLNQTVSKTSRSFDKVSVSAGKMLAVLGGTAAIIGFIKGVSDATIRFSKVMGELSAITGAVGKDLEFLKNASKEFGRTTLTSSVDAAEAMKLIASAKPELLNNLDALKSVTEQVITLSEAAGVNMPQAIEAAVGSLNQFGLGADQAARFVDVLAAGSKFGSSEVAETGAALQKAGVVASQAGLSFEELNAAIQVLAANGQKAEIAGTGLRGVLLKLMTQTNNQFNPAVVGLQKAFENLGKAGLSATEQKKLFGDEGITVAQILIKETEALAKMNEQLGQQGVALEQAAKNADTYAGRIKKLANAWESWKQTIGESGESSQLINNFTDSLNRSSKAIEKYGLLLGGLKSIFVNPVQQFGDNLGSAGLSPDSAFLKMRASRAGETSAGAVVSGQRVRNAIDIINERTKGPTRPTIAGAIDDLAFRSDLESGKKAAKQWKEALTGLIDPVGESLIPPMDVAGTKLEFFAETVQEASDRLQNAFTTSFGNPAERVANDLIAELGQKEKDKFAKDAENISARFKENIQEIGSLASQIKFAKTESEKNRLDKRLLDLQKDVFEDAFGGVSNTATPSLSIFSTKGDRQTRVMQSMAQQADKFVNQMLGQEEQRVRLIVELDHQILRASIKESSKAVITEITKQAATQGAR